MNFTFRDVWCLSAFVNQLGWSLIVIILYSFITTINYLIPAFMCATQDEKIQTCVHTCIQVALSQKGVVHIFPLF
ncbi:hypothetical protein B9Z55_027826 [Caenorhabditis nigoni]|uniref:Uncharacterized protein n=1 Tax=Caenorhabditis nigoni TaxID=1611254 RepID=A0A2G5SEW3_9PELO|nr:hypothetical protein B9Z55_027826 [Caenorhabditis nigoni]